MIKDILKGFLIGGLLFLAFVGLLCILTEPLHAQSNGLYRPDSSAFNGSPAPMQGLIIPRAGIVNIDTMVVLSYPAPAIYRRWWLEVQECTHLHTELDITDFSWIMVPGDGFVLNGNKLPVPAWAAVEKRNFLILTKYLMNERLVKHEMTHSLMWESGNKVPSHMGEFWTRCELIA